MNALDLPSAELNPWLACVVGLTCRWMVPGMAWGWLMCRADTPSPRWMRWITATAVNLLAGIMISSILAWILAESGTYGVVAEWVVLSTAAFLGLAAGCAWGKLEFLQHIRSSIPGLLLFALGVAALMNLPQRGEWILGGWDPGVYVNQGVYVARHGTFHPAALQCWRDLSPQEFGLLTRRFQGGEYVECFPGVPIDEVSRTFQFYFFRMTPTVIAELFRSGGLRAAVRFNEFVGLAAGLIFLACMLRAARPSHAVIAALFMAIQPIFLYHLHTPASEMLELALVCGAGFLVMATPRNWPAHIFLCIVFFVAILNRVSFVAFGTLFLAVLVLLDFGRPDRLRVLAQHVLLAGALGLGLFFDMSASAMIPRLGHILPALLMLCLIAGLVVLVIDLAACSERLRTYVLDSGMGSILSAFALISGAGVLIALWFFDPGWVYTWIGSAGRMGHFIGMPVLILAAAAAAVMVMLRHRQALTFSREFKGWILCLLVATCVLTQHKWVAELYPWSTKRFLVYAVPLVAALAAVVPSALFERWRRNRLGTIAAGLIIVGVLVSTARISWHAWHRTEYDGSSRVLGQVAAMIGPDDVVFADHQWWATPLTFIYDRQVFDGSKLWNSRNPVGRAGLEQLMARLYRDGKRVRLLSSSRKESVKADYVSEEVTLEEIAHHQRASDYMVRTRRFVFQLSTWKPLQ